MPRSAKPTPKILRLDQPAQQLANAWDCEGHTLIVGPTRNCWPSVSWADSIPVELPPHYWLASSGTSGLRKIIALSRQALVQSATVVNRSLAVERRDIWINSLPCHHVGGLSIYVRSLLSGSNVWYAPKWEALAFVRQAESSGATLASLVPTQLHDLVRAELQCPALLRAVVVGGAALDEGLHKRALELGWPVLRTYGMTETASQVATESSPGSSSSRWLSLLDHFEARTDEDGVLELRGPSLLTGWMIFENDGTARWEDPKRDGWFRTSDRVELRGRELRVLGRVDDLVKIRGELVDVGALETTLQAHVTAGRVAIYRLPDERNGASLRVVAENATALQQARALRDEIFPPYARPQEFVEGPVKVTALGKTIRHPGSRGARPPRP